MVVSSQSEFRTVQDLVSWSKRNPDKANYATSSPTFTLSTELFKLRTGSVLQSIPYRGSGESVTGVLGGQTTTAIVDPLPAMPLIQSGQIRALAITAGARAPELPDVPTMQEAGVADLNILIWSGIFARKGTPEAILTKLESEIRGTLQLADVKSRFRTLAADAVGNSSAEFKAIVEADLERWSAVVKTANISLSRSESSFRGAPTGDKPRPEDGRAGLRRSRLAPELRHQLHMRRVAELVDRRDPPDLVTAFDQDFRVARKSRGVA